MDRPDKAAPGGIDPAALAVAVLGATWSIFSPAGQWSPFGSIIGVTLLFLVLGYDVSPFRTRMQTLGYSGVVALAGVLVVGYPLELAWSTNRCTLLSGLVREPAAPQTYSDVPPIALLGVWLMLLLGVFLWKRGLVVQKTVEPAEASTSSG